jgi:hypothetical protein
MLKSIIYFGFDSLLIKDQSISSTQLLRSFARRLACHDDRQFVVREEKQPGIPLQQDHLVIDCHRKKHSLKKIHIYKHRYIYNSTF